MHRLSGAVPSCAFHCHIPNQMATFDRVVHVHYPCAHVYRKGWCTYTTLAVSGFISHRQASAREEGDRRTIVEENEQGNQDLEAPVEEEYALEQRVIPFMGDDLAAALTPMGTCCSTSER